MSATISVKGTTYKLHPACSLFPVMTDEALAELAKDIGENGQSVPVVMLGDLVLDGRNRLLACGIAGRQPVIKEWSGAGSPTAAVLSLNAKRRHLTSGQLAAIAAEALPVFEAEAKARKVAAAKATLKRGSESPVSANVRSPGQPHKDAETETPKGKASEAAAAAAGVSARSVETAKRVGKVSPELLAEVAAGKTTLHAAKTKVSGEATGKKPKKPKAATAPRTAKDDEEMAEAKGQMLVLNDECEALREKVKAMMADDAKKETAKWVDKYQRLSAVLKSEAKQTEEAKKQATYYGGILKRVAKIVGVEKYGEIPAVVAEAFKE